MHDELDEELARLAHSLRSRDHIVACCQLAVFAGRLDRYIRREERAFSQAPDRFEQGALPRLRDEHASLRRLVARIADALDRADDQRGVELVGKLRSVLLLHVAKEEWLLPPVHGAPG